MLQTDLISRIHWSHNVVREPVPPQVHHNRETEDNRHTAPDF